MIEREARLEISNNHAYVNVYTILVTSTGCACFFVLLVLSRLWCGDCEVKFGVCLSFSDMFMPSNLIVD